MGRDKNPLERIPSSRDGFSERDIRNKGTEYDNVIKKEFEESSDVDPAYEKKYVKKESFDLEGKKTPRVYSSIEEIPDEGPLPDEFGEKSKEQKEEEEKEAYIREYNKQSGRSLMDEEIDDEEDENDKEDENVGEYEEYSINEYDVNDPKISDIKDDGSFSDDNYRNKTGMRYEVDDDGKRARQPYDKGLPSDRPIRDAKKTSIYKKSA